MFDKLLQIWSATRKSCLVSSILSAKIDAHRVVAASNERRQHSAFLHLPVEIIQTIQSLLPLASAVSLVLTDRSLLEILGNELFRSINLPANADQRTNLLLSLQRDLSDWQFCHQCLVFHPLEKETDPCAIWRYDHEPECVQRSGCVYLLRGFRIRYQHAQLVMNRYRFGTLREDDLKMVSYATNHGKDCREVITASIEDGGLAIYMTTVLRLMKSWNAESIKRYLPVVCPHFDGIKGAQPQPLAATIRCQLNHDTKQSCIDCAKKKSCLKCRTLFSVEVQRVNTAEIIVQLHTRKWLGPCETPFDPSWRRHCESLPPTMGW